MEKYNKQKVHLLYLDSLRGIAATLVVLHHALLQVNFQGFHLNQAQETFLGLFRNGHYPVNFFIVLSGYCLMLPVIRSDYNLPGGASLFFKRRAKRILPAYYLAMLFSLLLIVSLIGKKTGTHWDVSIPVDKEGLVAHLLLIQDVFVDTAGKINHAFWSISVEWRIYFLFPVLLLLWRKVGSLKTLLLVAATSVFLLALVKYLHKLYPLLNNYPNGVVPHYLLLFTLGMLGADIAFSKRYQLFAQWKTMHWVVGLAVITGLIIVLSNAPGGYARYIPWQLIDILNGLGGVCLLVICNNIQHTDSDRYSTLKAIMSWRPLVAIGTFGYSLYLIHAPLLQVFTQYLLMPLGLSPFISFLILITVGLFFVLAVSYLFFLLCEKPFMTKPQPSVAIAAVAEPAP